MGRVFLAAVVAVALCFGWTAPARAQGDGAKALTFSATSRIGVITRQDTTSRVLSGPGDGSAYVRESDPDWAKYLVWPNMMQNSGVVEGNQDSSAVLDTRGWKHMAIAFYGAPGSTSEDSASVALLAVQIRGHYLSINDSLSTYVWEGTPDEADTTVTPAPLQIGTFLRPQVMTAGGNRGPQAVDDAVFEGEFLIYSKFSLGPLGRYITLCDKDAGRWFSAPYTSVRIRVVEIYGGNALTAALAAGTNWRWRADLVGWR